MSKITKGVYELGSVFKTFTIAAALENKVVNSNTIFKNLETSLTCDKHKISEHDKLPSNLSVEQILVRSSNIGSVKIAQKVGIENYKKFLTRPFFGGSPASGTLRAPLGILKCQK